MTPWIRLAELELRQDWYSTALIDSSTPRDGFINNLDKNDENIMEYLIIMTSQIAVIQFV